MDLMAVWLVGMGLFVLGLVAVMARATYMRFTGRRSRFDTFAQTMVRAQGAGIYPPSLRPDPETPVIEEIEDSRAARAERQTPSAPKSSPRE